MIEIPHTKGYRDRYWTDKPQCIVCKRLIKKSRHYIKSVYGSHAVTAAESEEIYRKEGLGADSGYYEVGSDCLKRHPELKPYVDDAAKVWARVER